MPKEWKQLTLDSFGCLKLSDILQSFSAPLNEQQAWAIIFQATRSFLSALEEKDGRQLYLVTDLRDILITKSGDVHKGTYINKGEDRACMKSSLTGLAELGVVVYDALDYNLGENNERSLSLELENILEKITSADEGHDDEDEGEDEGLDGGFDTDHLGTELIHGILKQCRHHLAVEQEAEEHYRGVCRALVNEALERSTFMCQVTSNSPANRQLQEELQKLDMGDWENLWTSVMSQLRTGVRLKKVDYSRTPVELEMTPYEMIMDDIRSKRYKLNHVEIPERLKKDAREVILDFIRSRPPLRSASARQLKPLRKESTPGELLMQDIRSCKARQSLRRTNMPKPIRSQFEEKSRTRLDKKLDNLSPDDKVNKKVIDLDESMLKNMLDFETEENSSNTSQEDVFLDESVVTPDTTPVSTSRKKSAGRRNSLNKSTDRRGSLVKSNWRKSVSVMESPTSQSTDLSTPILSPLTRKKDDIHEYLSSTVLGSKDWDFVRNLHSLDLTIEELAHIRAQLTKAELEEKNMGEEKKRDLEKGRLCFVCEVVKFGVFNWASYCIICNKYICSKCVTKIKLPSDNLREIPVSILTNQLCSNQHPDVEAEYSVLRRLSVQIGLPTTSLLPAPSPAATPTKPNPTTQHRPRLFRQQTSPDLKGSLPASTASRSGLERSGWNRNSMRNPSQVPSSIQQTAPSRPKLVRSKTMTKNDVEKLQALKLSQPGSLHSTCTTCRDILTCLVRAKMETDNLHKIKGRLTTFQEENITPY